MKTSYNLTFTEVTPSSLGLLEEVKGLYFSSFPEEERRPWESIISLIESEAPFFKFIIVKDLDDIVGFYSAWTFPQAIYVEHLAIQASQRGKGIGSAVMAHILEVASGKPVVVEVEPTETSEDAIKRIRFYESAGFTALYDFPYVQPPYAKGLPEVPLMLMSSAPLPDIELFVIQLHTLVYNK